MLKKYILPILPHHPQLILLQCGVLETAHQLHHGMQCMNMHNQASTGFACVFIQEQTQPVSVKVAIRLLCRYPCHHVHSFQNIILKMYQAIIRNINSHRIISTQHSNIPGPLVMVPEATTPLQHIAMHSLEFMLPA